MASIGSYLMPFLFVLIIIICIAPLALFDTSSSICPNNNDSTCNTLPFNINNPSDVWLNVPSLSVDEISLVVEDLKAHVSLSANVAKLVSFNAGVDVSVGKINLTMTGKIHAKKTLDLIRFFLGIKAQVQLAVHLDNVVKIITRTLASLDLNPFLPSTIDNISEKSFNLLGTLIDNGQFIHQIINKGKTFL
jgi:hypothetical protein